MGKGEVACSDESAAMKSAMEGAGRVAVGGEMSRSVLGVGGVLGCCSEGSGLDEGALGLAEARFSTGEGGGDDRPQFLGRFAGRGAAGFRAASSSLPEGLCADGGGCLLWGGSVGAGRFSGVVAGGMTGVTTVAATGAPEAGLAVVAVADVADMVPAVMADSAPIGEVVAAWTVAAGGSRLS